ncbi:hypothetical protein BLA24_32125 [Streptomyces cinnamoneus]|uniref:Uncharacterized protein n=1 Tax=Streptomyces cinnamoneus TaxID=53446 RepID=A0A2G1XA51_STRCJ|nr:hypothetical protein BLA24_32125 [Streptomyces cinnamoneus]PPT15717.1 hypothetical protein CYQ11_25185 [Streptomyces cinnamoneus]
MEGAVAVEEERVGRFGAEPDPRVDALSTAVSRLRRALAGHPVLLPDRDAAEDELAALDAMVRTGSPDVSRLRRSLLLVAGAVGSVSALAPALGEVRAAVDRFGGPSEGAGGEAELPRPREGA